MIKLIFGDPFYTYATDSNGISITVCKMSSTIVDTDTNEVYESNSFSGISKCSPNDSYDEQLGRDLALSRSKRKSYQHALTFGKFWAEDSIKWVIFICYMDTYLNREINHEHYLLNDPESYFIEDIRGLIMANLEARLPLLHGDVSDPCYNNALYI